MALLGVYAKMLGFESEMDTGLVEYSDLSNSIDRESCILVRYIKKIILRKQESNGLSAK